MTLGISLSISKPFDSLGKVYPYLLEAYIWLVVLIFFHFFYYARLFVCETVSNRFLHTVASASIERNFREVVVIIGGAYSSLEAEEQIDVLHSIVGESLDWEYRGVWSRRSNKVVELHTCKWSCGQPQAFLFFLPGIEWMGLAPQRPNAFVTRQLVPFDGSDKSSSAWLWNGRTQLIRLHLRASVDVEGFDWDRIAWHLFSSSWCFGSVRMNGTALAILFSLSLRFHQTLMGLFLLCCHFFPRFA